MNSNDTVILVDSFDGYSDIWETFAKGFNIFWKDRPYDTYLVTNNLKPDFEGIGVITTGEEISWSRRLRTALQKLDCKYVILLLEDYLICEKADNSDIERIMSEFREKNMDYLRIAPIPKTEGAKGNEPVKLSEKSLYGVNLQAGIWKKEYLLKLLCDDDFSAWQFEARQKNGAETQIKGENFALGYFLIPYLNGVIQGKWFPKTVESYKKLGIEIPTDSRGVMSRKQVLKWQARTGLAHHVPKGIIRAVKPVAKKLGFHFVTE